MSDATVHHGDCLDVLATLPDASVDAVVTDPPYGLEFMGKEWDSPWKYGLQPHGYKDSSRQTPAPNFGSSRNPVCRICRKHKRGAKACQCPVPDFDDREKAVEDMRAFQTWCEAWSRECLRVLKPGGHMLAFGGTRTFHRLACAVEDAGFEIRDSIAWLYGSGFPKSLDVSKAIDKAAGAEREVVGVGEFAARRPASRRVGDGGSPVGEAALHYGDGHDLTAPATDDARTWQGWGTALKPAFEPIVVARKPLAGTVAANVLTHGTGALNVDGCRVGDGADKGVWPVTDRSRSDDQREWQMRPAESANPAGRWPANVVLDESQAEALDAQSGESVSKAGGHRGENNMGNGVTLEGGKGIPFYERGGHDDSGGASRFFYVAKADSGERVRLNGTAHPTVKPLTLMRWLVRLVTPPGGTVLDPFAGSGTTVEAAILEGFDCIAIEREADYLPLIQQRIHRRRDPVAAVRATLEDAGLFDLIAPEDPA